MSLNAWIDDLCRHHDVSGVFVLTDSNVHKLTSGVLPGAPRLVVEAGEGSKCIAVAEMVWRFLIEGKALRRSLLVNLGGGMITDLGGFAAATFKRGMPFVNLPTTLLASVDAALGGKTGVNFEGLKNEVGVFAEPLGVYPLVSLFSSLPEEEWLSGVGEAVKTGLLDSEELFELTTSKEFIVQRELETVRRVVERCAAFKKRIVDRDFREKGLRRILNLGHTAGHAIEELKMSRGEYLPHGIAVAHGLREALCKSRDELGFPANVVEKYERILRRYFPPLEMSEKDWDEVMAYMAHDKKNREVGKTSWVLLENIGHPIF